MAANANAIPIYVDMDGTLVKTDVAQELVLQCFKSAALLPRLFSLLFSDRSRTKRFLAESTTFSVDNLPYNASVIDYIKSQKQEGRTVVLATASDQLIADRVAGHLGLFDDVLASEPGRNLKGLHKLAAIQDHANGSQFEYLGDSRADYPIWKEAARSGFVNPPKPAEQIVDDSERISLNINEDQGWIKPLLKAMRPHQWAKNVLVFLPLFFAHVYLDIGQMLTALVMFFAFSLAASGIYLINDLLDIEADRKHKTKKKRPFAAGKLSPVTGVVASGALVLGSLLLCFFALNPLSMLVLVVYLIITSLYSFMLKNYSTIDVITLTILYTIRIIAGGVAVGVVLSPWLINFSLFFFLSLAYMKRYIEIARSETKGGKLLSGRNYLADENPVIMTIGIVNGGISVFILTMYLVDPKVIAAYASPTLLWLICPLMLFWIYRAWMWAKRGKIDDDPVVFAIKDKISLLTAVLLGIVIMSAKYIDLSPVLI